MPSQLTANNLIVLASKQTARMKPHSEMLWDLCQLGNDTAFGTDLENPAKLAEFRPMRTRVPTGIMASMKISDEAIDEFIRLYKKDYNEDITRSQASEMAFRLVTLYELLTQKLPNKQNITPPDDPSQQPIGCRL